MQNILKDTERLPRQTLPVLEEHTNALHEILGDKLVGVYVHGSAALGGFTPQQSDLDYLAVVAKPLSANERARLSEVFLSLHGTSGFRKAVEMSIVEARFAGTDFRYPTPYEFHMGTLEQVERHGSPHRFEHRGPDLASHFTVVRERGVCVFGRVIAKVFTPVPRRDFFLSNLEDASNARDKILRDPIYVILNLCRTLFAVEDGNVYSKIEGARLYLRKQRELYELHELVRTALADYQSGGSSNYDPAKLQEFAIALLGEIERAVAHS
jgi:predicted nucleotidyltransferase